MPVLLKCACADAELLKFDLMVEDLAEYQLEWTRVSGKFVV